MYFYSLCRTQHKKIHYNWFKNKKVMYELLKSIRRAEMRKVNISTPFPQIIHQKLLIRMKKILHFFSDIK